MYQIVGQSQKGLFAPKEHNTSDITQFRIISLLNVEEKDIHATAFMAPDQLHAQKQIYRYIGPKE